MPRDLADPPATSPFLFCSVVLSTLGPFSFSSLARHDASQYGRLSFSSGALWGLVILEVVLAAVWVPILRARGWSSACMTAPAAPADLLRALGLVALSCGLTTFTTLAGRILFSDGGTFIREAFAAGHPGFAAVLAVSLVNPAAEEFLYLGFIYNVLRRWGRRFAVIVSVLARVSVHVYQGPTSLLGIAALGVLLTMYYSRSSRLWAVVFAHGFLDALAFATVSRHHAPH